MMKVMFCVLCTAEVLWHACHAHTCAACAALLSMPMSSSRATCQCGRGTDNNSYQSHIHDLPAKQAMNELTGPKMPANLAG